jgi:hypothetical protein
MYSATLRRVRVTIFFRGKAYSVAHPECVFVALGIQYPMRLRRSVLPSVVCLILPCFSTLSHQRYDFRGKNVIGQISHVLIFSTASFENISQFKKCA